MSVTFAASMAIAYFWAARKRKLVVLVPIQENTRVRMVGPGGSYRCYFLRRSKSGLVFSAPLQRDRYIPVRVGETMMVQAPLADCVLTFRAAITGRDQDSHEFTLAFPERIRHVDRRCEPRKTDMAGTIVAINGQPATIVDLSASGARIVSSTDVRPGDAVRVDLPHEYGTAYGWALESFASSLGRTPAQELRIRFETPLSGLTRSARRLFPAGT